MTDKEFQIAVLYLQDYQRLIAAGKSQRWDVVKWVFTVNTALGVASAVAQRAQEYVFGLSLLIAVLGWILISHYDHRVKGARQESDKPVQYLKNQGIDIDSITGGTATYRDTARLYDLPELVGFAYALFFISIAPAFLAWWLS
jgi:hypothetical protein